MNKLLITIDGPAGSGKTTVSRMLAERLDYRYVDTGALYRAVGLMASENGVDPENDDALEKMCTKLSLNFVPGKGGSRLVANGRDITDLIRTPEMSMMASKVSARPVVRDFLLFLQQSIGENKAAVFEGRDMGTVVFPGADVKFFLAASPEVRARRRHLEMGDAAEQSLDQVAADMRRRDENDTGRKVAPLKAAEGAIRIDSTDLSIKGVVERMLSFILPV